MPKDKIEHFRFLPRHEFGVFIGLGGTEDWWRRSEGVFAWRGTARHNQTFLVMSSLEKELKERAECLFQQKQLGKAVHDYRAKEEATRRLTFKLRVEHLAREAARAKPAKT